MQRRVQLASLVLVLLLITHFSMACALKKMNSLLVATCRCRPSAAFAFRTLTRTNTVKQRAFTTATKALSASSSTKESSVCHLSIADTPLGTKEGAALLDGLDVYSVRARDDDHPLSVYGIHSSDPIQFSDVGEYSLRPILLLHGRTWSSVPVYHLLGGEHQWRSQESRSLMEALQESGLQPYTMDFRGFGGTPSDKSGMVEPNKCVSDVESVLKWIAKRHGLNTDCSDDTYGLLHAQAPALLGWSQGALVAQLVAQKSPHLLSKLVLYGSIYDPSVRYPRAPLYTVSNVTTPAQPSIENQLDDAMEDFTVEGTIPPEPARLFAEAALLTDPIKAVWNHLFQFNNCDPARINVPTMVIAGDQDPYAPLHVQMELFSNLGRGADRTWSILADADHAAHLLDGRARFTNTITNFCQHGKRSDHGHFY